MIVLVLAVIIVVSHYRKVWRLLARRGLHLSSESSMIRWGQWMWHETVTPRFVETDSKDVCVCVCVCLILLLYRGMFWHIIYVSWDLVGTKSFVKIQRSKHYLEKILVWRMSLHRFFTIHDHGTSQGFIHVWMNHPFWKAAGYWRLQRRVPTLPVKPIKRGPGAPSLCQNWFPFLCWHKPLMLPWEYAPYACFTELTWRWGILRQFKCLSNGHQEKVSLLFSKESG